MKLRCDLGDYPTGRRSLWPPEEIDLFGAAGNRSLEITHAFKIHLESIGSGVEIDPRH